MRPAAFCLHAADLLLGDAHDLGTGTAKASDTDTNTETDTTEQQLLYFTLTEDGACLTDINRALSAGITSVEIPAEYDGFPVTAIGDYTFLNCTALKSVVIPDRATLPSLHPQTNHSYL